MNAVHTRGVLKWRSVLKQNSSAETHHSPATLGRFIETSGKRIRVHLLQTLYEEKEATAGEFIQQTRCKNVWATLSTGFFFGKVFVNQTGELIRVTY